MDRPQSLKNLAQPRRASKRHALRSLLASLVVLSFIFWLPHDPVQACGGESLSAVYAYRKHPDLPLNRYARGELGILRPTFARSYLFVAYRHLTGAALDEAEAREVTRLWDERLEYSWTASERGDDAKAIWIAARAKIVSPAPTSAPVAPNGQNTGLEIESTRAVGEYSSFINCTPDSFRRATQTLAERVKQYGADNQTVKSWIAAQDMVFTNCGGGDKSVGALPDGAADALARQDRAYQVAVANFYATRFKEARKNFEGIAGDSSSPYQKLARYMLLRVAIRQATLGGVDKDSKDSQASKDATANTTQSNANSNQANAQTASSSAATTDDTEPKLDKQALARAAEDIDRFLADTSNTEWRASAQRLRGFVRFRLAPEERFKELAAEVARPNRAQTIYQDLWDFTLLTDKLIGDDSYYSDPTEQDWSKLSKTVKDEALTDWAFTFQIKNPEATAHAIAKWKETNARHWLVAAVSKVKAEDASASELVRAAAGVERSSPAYLTLAYHRARLLLEQSRHEEARTLLDGLLAERAQLPASAANQLAVQRMLAARNLDDFLEHAARKPIGYSYDTYGNEMPEKTEDIAKDEYHKKVTGFRVTFDAETSRVLNEQLPVGLLKDAALSERLPAHLRREIAISAWVRAAILNDAQTGNALIPALRTLVPEASEYINQYQTAQTNEARRFAVLFAALRLPGLRPLVNENIGRIEAINERDSMRNNWWCAFRASEAAAKSDSGETTPPALPVVAFLNPSQRKQTQDEMRRLIAAGTAPNYLSEQAVAWAKANPDDPRAPEALHLAVYSTRYGCSDEQTGKFSKAAFQLLHQRYPRSEWAQKTKYWFN